MSEKSCPCHHTTPCHPNCTCVKPFMSRGCSRCCRYGSSEQQRAKAEYLAMQERFTLSEMESWRQTMVDECRQDILRGLDHSLNNAPGRIAVARHALERLCSAALIRVIQRPSRKAHDSLTCEWTNFDDQIDEGAEPEKCLEKATHSTCDPINGVVCDKHKCRCSKPLEKSNV